MSLTLSILAPLLRFLTSLCVLLLVLSFLRSLAEAFPILNRAKNRRSVLALTAILAWMLGAGATAWKVGLDTKLWLALAQGPNGELVQKATLDYFQEEIKGVSTERGNQARAYFDSAERDLAAMRYREAAESYGRSIQVLPTASGHLNLGIVLFYLSDFHQAEDVLLAGIQLPRQRGTERVEAAYLDAIGRAYLGQGRLEAALGSHRAALEIHTHAGNPLGRANAQANIGNVYLAQGRPEEALIAHREAFALYTRLGSRLGRANALNHIGNVHSRLGKQDEALRALQEALSLDTQIDNRLGQARDLASIGDVYAAQGKRRESLETLRQSRIVYQQIGASDRGVRILDGTIERLKAAQTRER